MTTFNALDINVSTIQHDLFQLELTEDAHIDAQPHIPLVTQTLSKAQAIPYSPIVPFIEATYTRCTTKPEIQKCEMSGLWEKSPSSRLPDNDSRGATSSVGGI
jgi:hypothetical protein